jgi:hypothetical protein
MREVTEVVRRKKEEGRRTKDEAAVAFLTCV